MYSEQAIQQRAKGRTLTRFVQAVDTELQDDLAAITASLAKFYIPEDILAADEEIPNLFGEKSVIQKSKKDCDHKIAERAELNRLLHEQVQRLRPGLALEDAARLEPGLLARKRIQELAPQATRLEANRDSLERSLEDARRKMAECDITIAALPENADTTILAAAIDRARRELGVIADAKSCSSAIEKEKRPRIVALRMRSGGMGT
ncbi:MAG: hypothetical protein ABSH56_14655 [Bryobacteraceae bacterium]